MTLPTIESDLESGTADDHCTTAPGYERDGVMETPPFTSPKHFLNDLHAQLQFESEVCPWLLRLIIILCAIGALVTCIVPYCIGFPLSTADVILSTLTTFLSNFIILLEGCFVSNDSVGCNASIRKAVVSNISFLRLAWRRGVLCLITGALQVAQMHTITYVSGSLMAVVGSVVIIGGARSSLQLIRLERSLADDAHLLYLFVKYDGDEDGYQVIEDFASFIVAVGLDLDDAYAVGAFKAIDKDQDGRISFIDFHRWWSQCSTVRGSETASLV